MAQSRRPIPHNAVVRHHERQRRSSRLQRRDHGHHVLCRNQLLRCRRALSHHCVEDRCRIPPDGAHAPGLGYMQLRAISRFDERHAAAFTSAVGITVEAVAQIKTIATLGLEREVLAMYKRTLAGPRKEILGASLYTNIWLATANSTGFLIYSFAYWWGSRLIMRGEYTQTQFFIILIAILVSSQLWGQMFGLAPEVARARRRLEGSST